MLSGQVHSLSWGWRHTFPKWLWRTCCCIHESCAIVKTPWFLWSLQDWLNLHIWATLQIFAFCYKSTQIWLTLSVSVTKICNLSLEFSALNIALLHMLMVVLVYINWPWSHTCTCLLHGMSHTLCVIGLVVTFVMQVVVPEKGLWQNVLFRLTWSVALPIRQLTFQHYWHKASH